MRFFVSILISLFIGCGPSAEEVPNLIKGLRSSDSGVRNESALKLGRIGSPHAEIAVPHLIPLLTDDNRGVQSSAAYALRRIDTPAARAALDRARRKFNQ